MLKLVISLCATTLFFGTAQADIVSTLNFTSPNTTSSTATITAGGTVDFNVDLTFDPSPQTPFGDPMPNCTGVITDCTEEQLFTSASMLDYIGGNLLLWDIVPGQFPFDGSSVLLTALGTSSFSITYPNPGDFEIFTYQDYPAEETIYELDCFTNFVNGVATGPAQCYADADRQISGYLQTAQIYVDVLPAEVPEPSYRILLAALLGVLFVVWRWAQSTQLKAAQLSEVFAYRQQPEL